MLGRQLLALGSVCLVAVSHMSGQKKHNIDCKAQFKYSETNVKIAANYLQKISGSVETSQNTATADKWTTTILDQQLALCQAYKASTEEQYPTNRYIQDLEALRAWQLDVMKLAGTVQDYNSKQATAAAGGKGPGDPELVALKTSVATQVESILNSPPHVEAPATAGKPRVETSSANRQP